MGLCFNGQPRQPRSLLIPTVQAWQNFHGSTSAASSLALRSTFHRQSVIANDREYSLKPGNQSSIASLDFRFVGLTFTFLAKYGRTIHPAVQSSHVISGITAE
jgi:hypothetical protein